jgi:hypothetical protein
MAGRRVKMATALTPDRIIKTLKKFKNNKAATARALGISARSLGRRLELVAIKGYSPEHNMTQTVPDAYLVKGVSSYFDKNGNLRGQWVKSNIDPEKVQRLVEQVVAGLKDEIPKVEKRARLSKHVEEDLLNQYTITDFHLGMLSWKEETGAEWNLNMAEDMLVRWFQRAIELAPQAKTAVFAQLGDFLHWDGLDAVTPTHRHVLDADTRFQKLVRVAIRVIRRIIAMLLDKHQEVIVLMAEGNHDLASSVWLRELLSAMYDNEPRVTINVSPDPYYCVEHGATALFYHHGHKKRPSNIDTVFAAKFREVYGRSKFAYGHMGHLHHIDLKETNLMVIEQHRTLASPDAHSSREGYISGRDAQVITYSKRFGEVSRLRISNEFIA